MILEHLPTVDKPNTIAAARRTVQTELARLQADRAALDAEIAKRQQFLAASDALFPSAQVDAAPANLSDIPKEGYGALTRAVKTILAQNTATIKQLTLTLHKAGFLKDPNDPTPVRTVIKGLRKRGQAIQHDPATGTYKIPR